jgi:hypothetical protein
LILCIVVRAHSSSRTLFPVDGTLVLFLRTFPRIINLKTWSSLQTLPPMIPLVVSLHSCLVALGKRGCQTNWEPETLCTSCLIALLRSDFTARFLLRVCHTKIIQYWLLRISVLYSQVSLMIGFSSCPLDDGIPYKHLHNPTAVHFHKTTFSPHLALSDNNNNKAS